MNWFEIMITAIAFAIGYTVAGELRKWVRRRR